MTNRFDKLEWLKENTTGLHVKEMFLTQMVSWMGEDDFEEFFKWHCRIWNIATPFDKDEDDSPNEFIVNDDEMIPVD